MTRTTIAAFPRAVMRDRSESKSGLDKSLRKNGAGQHNWGSLHQERALEIAALDDWDQDTEEVETSSDTQSESLDEKSPELRTSKSVLTQEELETAKKFRKNALKAEVLDLSAIARTSTAVYTS